MFIRVMSIDEERNSRREITMIPIQIVYPNHTSLHTSKQRVCSVEVGALAPVFKKKISYRVQAQTYLDAKTLI